MNLTDEQKSRVAEWVEGGASLNDIQKRLKEDLGITITYLETRFLVSDLGLAIKEARPAEKPKEEAEGDGEGTSPLEALLEDGDEDDADEDADAFGGGPGNVDVSVDSLAVPGAIVSGKVTFSDGKKAAWYLDQMGRLGINPPEPGYQPSQSDLMLFQTKLEDALRRQGF